MLYISNVPEFSEVNLLQIKRFLVTLDCEIDHGVYEYQIGLESILVIDPSTTATGTETNLF